MKNRSKLLVGQVQLLIFNIMKVSEFQLHPIQATKPINNSSLLLSVATRLSKMKTLLNFFLFLATICANIISAVHSKCIEDQQLSLLHLKQTVVFDSSVSSKLISWNSSTDCCSWVGVTCSSNGHVIGLDLSTEFISSGLDNSSSLFDLQDLQSLNLAYNYDFSGSQIPTAIGKLTNLRYLNLSHNS